MVALLAGIAHFGRFISGFLRGVFPPSGSGTVTGGIFAGIKSAIFGSSTVKILLLAGLCAVCFTGCKTYQLVSTTSATGIKLDASVPIPTASGTMIGLSLIGGTWKQTTVLQPTETNGVISAPSIVVAQSTRGKGDASGGVTTNATAGITAGVLDQSIVLTGTANSVASNNPAVLELNTAK